MKTILFTALISAWTLTGTSAKPLQMPMQAPPIVRVADGCGSGFYRNFNGVCKSAFFRPYGYNNSRYGWHSRYRRYN